jgi:hypothetical protein
MRVVTAASIIKRLRERAIDAFVLGLPRSDLIEEMGRTKPKAVSELMEVANRFADGEDAYHNKRERLPNMVGQIDTIARDADIAMMMSTTRATK